MSHRWLEHTESAGCLDWADPAGISERARARGAALLPARGVASGLQITRPSKRRARVSVWSVRAPA